MSTQLRARENDVGAVLAADTCGGVHPSTWRARCLLGLYLFTTQAERDHVFGSRDFNVYEQTLFSLVADGDLFEVLVVRWHSWR